MFFPAYENPLVQTAMHLGMSREWLYNIIALESGWNADAANKSGAVGLIQFMPCTLKDMGVLSTSLANQIPPEACTSPPSATLSDALKQKIKADFLAKYPNVESQLAGPVLQYFSRYRPFPTEQSVYLAVFLPAFRNKSLDTAFPDWVRKGNPGIDTVGDYVALVQKRARQGAIAQAGIFSLGVIAPIAALIYYFSGRRKNT